jgi:hypothetical protein
MREAAQDKAEASESEESRQQAEGWIMRVPIRLKPAIGVVVAVLVSVMAVSAAPTSAATPGPGWEISSIAAPSNFSKAHDTFCQASTDFAPTGCDEYRVVVRNIGTRPSSGPVTVTDTLPPGLTLPAGFGSAYEVVQGIEDQPGAKQVESRTEETVFGCTEVPVQCVYKPAIPPNGVLEMVIHVEVDSVSPTVENTAMVEGGGGVTVSSTESNTEEASEPLPFAISGFGFGVHNVAGAVDSQAGEHTPGVTASFEIPTVDQTTFEGNGEDFKRIPAHSVKDVVVELPPGFVGDPQAAPRCTLAAFDATVESQTVRGHPDCPEGSEIGALSITSENGFSTSNVIGEETSGIFNLVPESGHPAEFGFTFVNKTFVLYPSVVPMPTSPGGYALRVTVPEIPDFYIVGTSVTFFGQDADGAFLTNPTDCSSVKPPVARMYADAWDNPGSYNTDGTPKLSEEGEWKKSEVTLPAITGCDALTFNPTFSLTPEKTEPDTPTGLDVDLGVPQHETELATPDLKDAVVTLPEGLTVSPSAANGLGACTEGEIALGSVNPATCPPSSSVGSVEVTTPLLASPLEGQVFLGLPLCGNPTPCTAADAADGKMVRLYIQIDGQGVVIKLPGEVSLDPGTGRLTARFEEDPQLPFSDFKLEFKGGETAPLATPTNCGTYTTTTDLTPWSTPETPDATPASSFAIAGCSGSPFAPSFSAGTVTPSAGTFSPFVLSFSRRDGEQNLAGLTVTTPPGLLGIIKGVEQCPEPQSQNGECGEGSLIGHAQVAVGSGKQPFWVSGKVYLTGSYRGQPFGLSVVVPTVAGPFTLAGSNGKGDEVVRAAIGVNPNTAQITVVSNPFPQILSGVPLRIQTVNVTIDRPGFMFNPTNCDQQSVTGTISSAQGTTVGVSDPFAVASCANLPFKPSFTVSTQGRTSKADGASLVVEVSQKAGEANIHKVDLQLPLALPARLTTLQKACTEAQFNANPAGCPAASVIGTATAITPVLSSPLVGPAYLVSHGGAAFPDVEFILQGEGVTIVLDGKTDIKKGITYSNFETVPDAPISSFVTTLPEGPHSALAANANLCATSKTVTVKKRVTIRSHGHTTHVTKKVKQTVETPLEMPTKITGQNGAVVTQTTKIAVTGCPKVKKTKRTKKKKKK